MLEDVRGAIDYKWLLLVLAVSVGSAGAGFLVGMWLGS